MPRLSDSLASESPFGPISGISHPTTSSAIYRILRQSITTWNGDVLVNGSSLVHRNVVSQYNSADLNLKSVDIEAFEAAVACFGVNKIMNAPSLVTVNHENAPLSDGLLPNDVGSTY